MGVRGKSNLDLKPLDMMTRNTYIVLTLLEVLALSIILPTLWLNRPSSSKAEIVTATSVTRSVK